jgi:hypothetical protein
MNPALRNLIITVVVLVVIGLGIFLYARRATAPTTTMSGQTATSTGLGITYTGSSTAQVSEVPSSSAPAAPSYKTPLVFIPSVPVPADIQVDLNAEFASTTATIASNPTNFDAWVNLGTLRKMSGDYQGAVTDWTYVTQLYPQSAVGFEDLANIYLDFIKNYPKAEADYKEAIALNPQDDSAYTSLVSLYTTYGYGNPAEARTLVAAGVKANPNDTHLLQLQAQLNASN